MNEFIELYGAELMHEGIIRYADNPHATDTFTYNPEFGARPVRRFIQDKIEDMIADRIVQGKKSPTVTVTALK